MQNVKFVNCTREQFDALQEKDTGTIYFVQDGEKYQIFKGNLPCSMPVNIITDWSQIKEKYNEEECRYIYKNEPNDIISVNLFGEEIDDIYRMLSNLLNGQDTFFRSFKEGAEANEEDAYGYGKSIEFLTQEQYDNWTSEIPLNPDGSESIIGRFFYTLDTKRFYYGHTIIVDFSKYATTSNSVCWEKPETELQY